MNEFYTVQVIIERVNTHKNTNITQALEQSSLFNKPLRFHGGAGQIWFETVSSLRINGNREDYAQQLAHLVREANEAECNISIRLTDKTRFPYGEYDLGDELINEDD